MHSLGQDIRYALRSFTRRPLYAVVTVTVLALAIGANTTVFSVFNGLFLRPLPYPDDERLVSVYNTYPGLGLEFAGTSIPDYLDRRAEAPSLEDLAIVTRSARTLTGEGPAEQLSVAMASASLFSVLGVPPELGRAFTDAETVPGADDAAVLSHALWTSRFGAAPDAIGREIRLDGRSFRVVGVMPAGFGYPDRDTGVWVPFAFTPEQMSDAGRGQEFSTSVGRLAPGATIEGLNAELDAIVARTNERLPDRAPFIESTGFTGRAELLRDAIVGDLETMLLVLEGIVLAVLLIASANVTNLQLARVAARRKELSVRAALGADRGRLARLVVIESLVLAAIGAVLGTGLSKGGLELVRVLGLDFSHLGFEFELDATVLFFTAGAALLAAFLSALLPVLMLVRDDLVRAVHEAGRLGGGGRSAQAFRATLVVVQIAVSAALLVAAGMLTKSFNHLQNAGTGFNAENVWSARIALPRSRYSDGESRTRFYAEVLEALGALPGVTRAGFTSSLPFSGGNSQGSIAVEGYEVPRGGVPPHVQTRSISEAYLPALDIPIVAGRNFASIEPERVVIVDENMADKYWPEGDVLGQRVVLEEPYTIIGVVPAVKHETLADDARKETVYWHYAQRPSPNGMLVLRSALPPDQLTGVVEDALGRIDPDVPLFDVRSLDARVVGSLGGQRAPVVLTLIFAAGAFLLAVVGIYGVLTWAVTQRFGEIGLRIALGARARDITAMVLRQGGRLTATGLAIGLGLALVLARLLASQIYDVAPLDPVVFGTALCGLAIAALLATWLPARRAARIDPMRVLRQE